MSDDSAPPFLSSLAHHAADPFRLLVESVVDYAIVMLDPAGHVASWNPGAERIYGYQAEAILGQPFDRFYPPEQVTDGAPARALAAVLTEGHLEQEDTRLRGDGRIFHAITTLSNLKDPFGVHAGFSMVTRDITERKHAEVVVREERDLSASILGSLPGIYYMCDEQGHFLRWNARLETVTEYTHEEIGQLPAMKLFASEDQEWVAEAIADVFRTGLGEIEVALVAKSGHRIQYCLSGIRADIGGRSCLIGMGMDLSALRRNEEALRTADERLWLVAEAMHVGLWDWNIQTDAVYYSPEWKRQVGWREGDAFGEHFDEWQHRLHPDDSAGAMRDLRDFIADASRHFEGEFRLRHRDGSYRTIFCQALLRFDADGTPMRMLGWHVDITEQRRTERHVQQAQKMEAIGRLAAGVAHDFNNLLTIINGNGEQLLEQMGVEGPSAELLLEMLHAGESAATLTRQLLAFGRQQQLALQPLSLNAVVRDSEKILRRLVGDTITLTTALPQEIGIVKADVGLMEQVLLNLVVNARDAMPEGGCLAIETSNVRLEASYCRAFGDLAPGAYVLLTVTDTGSGMDDLTQVRIFEPFFTTKEVGQGTGLGLATVHGIVSQLKGHVAVYSEIGNGATFKVYLPQVLEPTTEARAQAELRGIPRGNETILLVEDDPVIRAFGVHILAGCGYQVLEAADGRTALAVAEEHEGTIDLLISDLVMPHLGGRELSQALAAGRPAVRVIFLSGHAQGVVIRQGALGADCAVLSKPFTSLLLANRVREVLDGAHPGAGPTGGSVPAA